MNADRYLIAAIFAVVAFGIPAVSAYFPLQTYAVMSAIESAGAQVAAVIISHNPKTVVGLQSTYDTSAMPAQRKVRILIVPGHEPDYGGAEYNDLKERDLNVELANNLVTFLQGDSHFEVFTPRDTQAWAPEFAKYFTDEAQNIKDWALAHKAEVQTMRQVGTLAPAAPSPVYHNRVPDAVAWRIYGINKWADDHSVDIVIHIHFNDYPGHGGGEPGKYNGFAIYVPEKQYFNSTTTKAVAEMVSQRLAAYNPISNLHGENSGLVEDQNLIAIGPNNSLNAASMLIEYAYIYEPQLESASVRPLFLKDLAYQTYLGVHDFFQKINLASSTLPVESTLLLPHAWKNSIDGTNDDPTDVFALQTALIVDGEYPPQGETLNDCPRSPKFGACTKIALKAFQDKYGITGEKDNAGPKTINKLNSLFSPQAI